MKSTYEEPVLRFRVMCQYNDPQRNPNGYWSILYSSSSREDAEDVLQDREKFFSSCGDKYEIVEGEPSTITRWNY